MTGEDGGRDWSDDSTSQGISKTARQAPEATREAWDRCALTALRGNQPHQHLGLGLLASRTVKTTSFYCFKPLSMWYFVSTPLVIDFRPPRGSPRLEVSCPAIISRHWEAFVCFPDPKWGQPGLLLACPKLGEWTNERVGKLEVWLHSQWVAKPTEVRASEWIICAMRLSESGRASRKPQFEVYFLPTFLRSLEAAP